MAPFMAVMTKRNKVPIYLAGIFIELTECQPWMLDNELNVMNSVSLLVKSSSFAVLAFIFEFSKDFSSQV
jgi:uncharacterized protein YlzI (FlbEa/FlbD family)